MTTDAQAQELQIHPATPRRWADLRAVLAPKSAERACWCVAWRLPEHDFAQITGEQREAYLRSLVSGDLSPGLLAYHDGRVVGWCNVGPRTAMGRLVDSPAAAGPDASAWSVVCFAVRPGYQDLGVADELLRGAIEYAGQHGALVLEGYPIGTADRRVSSSLVYVGTRDVFEREGFRQVGSIQLASGGLTRSVMRLNLAPQPH